MSKTVIIDYDAGNTSSVMKALKFIGEDAVLSRDPSVLRSADRIVFPGVGAYYDAMNKLKSYELTALIRELVKSGKPFLGICLGMQLLFDQSEETIGCADPSASQVEGLHILPGSIKRFKQTEGCKIPHMGWNSINICKPDSLLFRDIPNGSYVYFVHSYYLQADDREHVASQTDYIRTFDSAVECGNVFGCQFHPEKSGDIGLTILRNFCRNT